MGKLLSKAEIISVIDLPTEQVAVPEWGGDVLVRGLTGSERDAFEEESLVKNGTAKADITLREIRARLVSRCLVDENGQRMFSDSEVDVLGRKSALALNRVFEVAQKISGLSDKDVAELTKNSESAPSGASSSG
jgi:hypothetical protein